MALAVIAMCGVGSALPSGASAAATPPTLNARTTFNGTQLPQALANGSWKAAGKGWQLNENTVAPPGGRTALLATWHAPTVQAVKGTTIFTSGLLTSHQNSNPQALSSQQQMRVCVSNGCSKWFTLKTPTTPGTHTVTAPPLKVTVTSGTGLGVAVLWIGNPTTLHVEWNYYQLSKGPDSTKTTLSIAAS